MIEILFIYQLARNPLQAIARRWWCRSLFRASRGSVMPECTNPEARSTSKPRNQTVPSWVTRIRAWRLT